YATHPPLHSFPTRRSSDLAQRVHGYFSDVPMRRLPRLRPPWSNVSIVRWFGAQEDFVSRLNPVSRLVLYRMHVPKPRCGHSVGLGLTADQQPDVTTLGLQHWGQVS